MRTVTFSDAEVIKQLNDTFVCAWVNRRPDLKFKDGLYGPTWKPSGLSDGAGVTNVTSVFATSDGTILHAVPGFLNPAAFKRHLAFARRLHLRLTDPEVKSNEDRSSLYSQAHVDASKISKERKGMAAHHMMSAACLHISEFKVTFFDDLGEWST